MALRVQAPAIVAASWIIAIPSWITNDNAPVVPVGRVKSVAIAPIDRRATTEAIGVSVCPRRIRTQEHPEYRIVVSSM